MCLQHRGQDSVGISNEYSVKKYNGLVKYAFQNENFTDLSCQNYMGHVRYMAQTVCLIIFNHFIAYISKTHNIMS